LFLSSRFGFHCGEDEDREGLAALNSGGYRSAVHTAEADKPEPKPCEMTVLCDTEASAFRACCCRLYSDSDMVTTDRLMRPVNNVLFDFREYDIKVTRLPNKKVEVSRWMSERRGVVVRELAFCSH
jgi:hypothetical protein